MEPNTIKQGFKLSKEDVWGKYDGNLMVSAGKLVARGIPDADGKYFTQKEFDRATSEIPNICPIWKDKMLYKSVTVVCDEKEFNEVSYWLDFVHGGGTERRVKSLPNNKIAIRSNYQCW